MRRLSKREKGDPQSPVVSDSNITVSNRQRARRIDVSLLKKVAVASLAELKIERAELGIVVVGAKEMASLNESFLQHEGPTDVITFDYSESPIPGAIHGEIFVCMAEAEHQAKIFRTNWNSEVVRYVIHGILHLAGYDDLQSAARKKMKRQEERLLRKLCPFGSARRRKAS